MAVSLIILMAAALAAAALVFLEWRRPDRRHLLPRLAATALAVAALAGLGVAALSDPAPSASVSEASLFTPGSPPAAAGADHVPLPRFALPGVSPSASATVPVPDAAGLRRRFPALKTLHVYGDGLDPADLPALDGLRVVFHAPATPGGGLAGHPAIRFLRCPRELPLGQPLVVRGRLTGLAAGQTARLTLAAPDGASVETASDPANPQGEAPFTLRAAALPATGRFLWRLHVGDTDLPLGVTVVPPLLPRVLVFEAAPRFDTAALRRWFEAAGGTLATHTRVGQDRFRDDASQGGPPPAFAALDAPTLGGYDLLLLDGASLLALSPGQRTALLAAVRDTGLGLLTMADDAVLPPPPGSAPFLPWTLLPVAGDYPPGEDRSARLRWPGQLTPTDLPISTAPFEINLAAGQSPLLTDPQNRVLAAASPQGRGQLALTLVRDTTRWQRAGDPSAFADHWSHLFSRLARPVAHPVGHWSLLDGDAGPVFVDHPLHLLWSGPPGPAPDAAVVTTAAAAAAPATSLALAPDPAEPTLRHALFWPRQPGWHHVAVRANAPGWDFYVHPAGGWPTLDAARRRAATAAFAEASASAAPANAPAPRSAAHVPPTPPPGWLFALFFAGAGYLWTERRLTTT